MATYQGVELHRVGPVLYNSGPAHLDEFYRIIRFDATVVVRHGTRGQKGTPRVRQYANAELAQDFVEQATCIYRDQCDCELVYASSPAHITPDILSGLTWVGQAPDPTDSRSITRACALAATPLFFDQWRNVATAHALGAAPDQRCNWYLAIGLLGERGKDLTADVVLDYLQAGPHAIDHATDFVIGQAENLSVHRDYPYKISTPRDTTGPRMRTYRLPAAYAPCPHADPACVGCATRVAELLVYLIANRPPPWMAWDDRFHLLDTAHRLARLPTSV